MRSPRRTRQAHCTIICTKFIKPPALLPPPSTISDVRALAARHACSPSSPPIPICRPRCRPDRPRPPRQRLRPPHPSASHTRLRRARRSTSSRRCGGADNERGKRRQHHREVQTITSGCHTLPLPSALPAAPCTPHPNHPSADADWAVGPLWDRGGSDDRLGHSGELFAHTDAADGRLSLAIARSAVDKHGHQRCPGCP